MTDDQIKHMVNRFLAWRLPDDFNPDDGISFKPTFNDHMDPPSRHEPVGTNLFDYTQAEAMVRHMVEGLTPPLHTGPTALADLSELLFDAYEDHQKGAAAGDTLFDFMAKRVRASLGGVEQQEDLGSSAQEADTHRGADGPVVGWQPIETLPDTISGPVEFLGFAKQGNHPGDWAICRREDVESDMWRPEYWMPLPPAPDTASPAEQGGEK